MFLKLVGQIPVNKLGGGLEVLLQNGRKAGI